MGYPMKEVVNPFGGTAYREMTAKEYEERLNFYRKYMETHENDSSRRGKDYIDYLSRWFSKEFCDGCDSFEARYKLHRLPMAANVYMFE